MKRSYPDPKRPLLSPLQRVDALALLAVTPNRRRLRVLVAWLGITMQDLYTLAGVSLGNLGQVRTRHDRMEHWQREGALLIAFHLPRVFGLAPTELWEIDEDFSPADCIPLDVPHLRDSRLRVPVKAKAVLKLVSAG